MSRWDPYGEAVLHCEVQQLLPNDHKPAAHYGKDTYTWDITEFIPLTEFEYCLEK
jgi:hypothetical protein